MKKILALFYQNLKNKGNEIPYILTVGFVMISVVMHFFQLIIVLKLPPDTLTIIKFENLKIQRWLNSVTFLTPVLILILFFIKRSDLEKYEFSENQLRRANTYSILYFILSLLFLFFLLIKKGIEEPVN